MRRALAIGMTGASSRASRQWPLHGRGASDIVYYKGGRAMMAHPQPYQGKGHAMENEKSIQVEQNPTQEEAEMPEEGRSDAGEFKITVRKLELPVRPRGVLAE